MSDQIPPALIRKLLAFLVPGRSGQIVLNVADGRILTYELREVDRVERLLKIDAANGNGVDCT